MQHPILKQHPEQAGKAVLDLPLALLQRRDMQEGVLPILDKFTQCWPNCTASLCLVDGKLVRRYTLDLTTPPQTFVK